jgi:hypothetical protein
LGIDLELILGINVEKLKIKTSSSSNSFFEVIFYKTFGDSHSAPKGNKKILTGQQCSIRMISPSALAV